MIATVKELAKELKLDELMVRQIITLFGIPIRGEGIKPARGQTPKTYALSDLHKVIGIINTTRAELGTTTQLE